MEKFIMHDVGDGLSISLRTMDGKYFQLDCGGSKEEDASCSLLVHFPLCHRLDSFILSHFHYDHYNGLIPFTNRGRQFYLKSVHFPLMPKFPENEELLLDLLALNAYRIGRMTGIAELDFIELIKMLNNNDFTLKALFKGEKILIGSGELEVLWPPEEMDMARFKIGVRKAIKSFEKALKEVPDLRKIYDQIKRNPEWKVYLHKEGKGVSRTGEQKELPLKEGKGISSIEMPESLKAAERFLRGVLNRISLAFYEDNRFLFLGDLEREEIGYVIDDLKQKGKTFFRYLFTAHHGTHWHDKIKEIRSKHILSSAGHERLKDYQIGFKEYAKENSATQSVTFINGSINENIYDRCNCPFIMEWGF